MKGTLLSLTMVLLIIVMSCGGEISSTATMTAGDEPTANPPTQPAALAGTLEPESSETAGSEPTMNPATLTAVPTATLKPGFSEARPTATSIPTATLIPIPAATVAPTSPPTPTKSLAWIQYELEVEEYFLFNYARNWAMLDNNEFNDYWTDWQSRIDEEEDNQEKAQLQDVHDSFYNTGCQPVARCLQFPVSATDAERAEFVINKFARGVNEYTKAAVACYLVAWPGEGEAYSPLLGVYRTAEQHVWHIVVTGPSHHHNKQEFSGTYNSQTNSCAPEHLGTRLPVSANDLLADQPEFPEPPPR